MCLVGCSRQVPGFLGDFENRKKVGKFDFNKVLRSKSKDREQKMKTNKELTVHLVVNLRFFMSKKRILHSADLQAMASSDFKIIIEDYPWEDYHDSSLNPNHQL
jgi:hypothetical protein